MVHKSALLSVLAVHTQCLLSRKGKFSFLNLLFKNAYISYDNKKTMNYTAQNYTAQAIFSSSSSQLVLPTDMYQTIMNFILYNKTNIQIEQTVLSTCNLTQYPSIFLLLNDSWFEIPPSLYVQNASYSQQYGATGSYCALAIEPQEANLVILGAPFMQNYYVIFDVDQDIIGVSNVYSNATLMTGPIPPRVP